MHNLFDCDQSEEVKSQPEFARWKVLIVDDEPDIHQVTQMVLAHLEVEGRRLELISAFSAEQARIILHNTSDIALAFIDVVMETSTSGLDLVRWIRTELKNSTIRLVLRTGQPGSAPEESVVRDFDINDYKAKTELTTVKLNTCIYSAIRGYRDIMTIQRSLEAFRLLIKSSTNILKIRDLKFFASSVLDNLLHLMQMTSSAIYIERHEKDIFDQNKHTVLASTGDFSNTVTDMADVPDFVKAKIDTVFRDRENLHTSNEFVGYFETSESSRAVMYVEFKEPVDQLNIDLLALYSTNVTLMLESLLQQQQNELNQRELLYIVANSIEARSKETGLHVKRVALACKLMAQILGLNQSFIDAITTAAPMHDLGKVAIPETILHKPGKLTAEEWVVMQSHTTAGFAILEQSSLPVSKMASHMARWHHENWDGSGYPDCLKGNSIPIEARIMAIVDVFDALGSARCYKPAWDDEQIKAFLEEQRAIKFDPTLIDLFMQHYEEFRQIRTENPD